MSRRRIATLIPAVLMLVAGVARFVMLDQPGQIIFDETYYVNDARDYLAQTVESGFAVHPPVGKWLIAAGIQVFGDNAFGWRVAAAVAGTLIVLLVYLIGARLLRWRGAAALAALLVAFDGLMFVQSRTAMLDIFLALFVVLGAWLLLVDFQRNRLGESLTDVRRRLDLTADPDRDDGGQDQVAVPAGGSTDQPPGQPGGESDDEPSDVEPEVHQTAPRTGPLDHLPGRRSHLIRVLAGVAFGLAVATKWSGLLALGVAGLVVLGWELAWRRRLTASAFTGIGGMLGSVAVTLVVVPAAVYALSYVPWLVNFVHTTEAEEVCPTENDEVVHPCDVGVGQRLQSLVSYHDEILDFHLGLEAEHTYRAPAYTWLYLGRPVVYYYESCTGARARGEKTENDEGELVEPEPCVVDEGNAAEIFNLGNPALWGLAGLSLIPLALAGAVGDRRAWYLIAFAGGQFVPWLIVSRPAFFFYMTPIVPFMALSVGFALNWVDEVWARRTATAPHAGSRRRPTVVVAGVVAAVLALSSFLYFYPVYSGLELDDDVVSDRWWVQSWI